MKSRKSIVMFFLLVFITGILAGCSSSSGPQSSNSYSSAPKSSGSSSSSSSSSSKTFTNEYGTPTTKCAHSGCNNYIASSGDTNCCTLHSNKCADCGKYIDEDATWCMDCLTKAANKSQNKQNSSSTNSSKSNSSKGPWHSSNVESDGMGPYPCYGKNDTCTNFTYNYQDLYCDKCDPDGDNVENK